MASRWKHPRALNVILMNRKKTIELEDLAEELSNENNAITLVNSVHGMFREVKNALQYGRDGLKFDTVVSTLRTRDFELKQDKGELGREDKKEGGYSLYTRDWSSNKENVGKKKGRSQSHGKSKSRMRGNK